MPSYEQRRTNRDRLEARIEALTVERDPVQLSLKACHIMGELKEESVGDTEVLHVMADDLLCAVLRASGHGALVDAFVELDKWYA